jgi:hypothetical protein
MSFQVVFLELAETDMDAIEEYLAQILRKHCQKLLCTAKKAGGYAGRYPLYVSGT